MSLESKIKNSKFSLRNLVVALATTGFMFYNSPALAAKAHASVTTIENGATKNEDLDSVAVTFEDGRKCSFIAGKYDAKKKMLTLDDKNCKRVTARSSSKDDYAVLLKDGKQLYGLVVHGDKAVVKKVDRKHNEITFGDLDWTFIIRKKNPWIAYATHGVKEEPFKEDEKPATPVGFTAKEPYKPGERSAILLKDYPSGASAAADVKEILKDINLFPSEATSTVGQRFAANFADDTLKGIASTSGYGAFLDRDSFALINGGGGDSSDGAVKRHDNNIGGAFNYESGSFRLLFSPEFSTTRVRGRMTNTTVFPVSVTPIANGTETDNGLIQTDDNNSSGIEKLFGAGLNASGKVGRLTLEAKLGYSGTHSESNLSDSINANDTITQVTHEMQEGIAVDTKSTQIVYVKSQADAKASSDASVTSGKAALLYEVYGIDVGVVGGAVKSTINARTDVNTTTTTSVNGSTSVTINGSLLGTYPNSSIDTQQSDSPSTLRHEETFAVGGARVRHIGEDYYLGGELDVFSKDKYSTNKSSRIIGDITKDKVGEGYFTVVTPTEPLIDAGYQSRDGLSSGRFGLASFTKEYYTALTSTRELEDEVRSGFIPTEGSILSLAEAMALAKLSGFKVDYALRQERDSNGNLSLQHSFDAGYGLGKVTLVGSYDTKDNSIGGTIDIKIKGTDVFVNGRKGNNAYGFSLTALF